MEKGHLTACLFFSLADNAVMHPCSTIYRNLSAGIRETHDHSMLIVLFVKVC